MAYPDKQSECSNGTFPKELALVSGIWRALTFLHAYAINLRETPAVKLSNIYKQLCPNLKNNNNKNPQKTNKKKKPTGKAQTTQQQTNKNPTHKQTKNPIGSGLG